jgi:16S rRNA A1518/A1519 N6-dimethyltransferase RsmA/KsgA/DIM1 with predicted DNA glycosylase/AP lyase activity
MNTRHQQLCSSPGWAAHLQGTVLPAVTAGVVLGDELLELGPGPGAATDWLRKRVRRLVAIEADGRIANALTHRFLATNVENE